MWIDKASGLLRGGVAGHGEPERLLQARERFRRLGRQKYPVGQPLTLRSVGLNGASERSTQFILRRLTERRDPPEPAPGAARKEGARSREVRQDAVESGLGLGGRAFYGPSDERQILLPGVLRGESPQRAETEEDRAEGVGKAAGEALRAFELGPLGQERGLSEKSEAGRGPGEPAPQRRGGSPHRALREPSPGEIEAQGPELQAHHVAEMPEERGPEAFFVVGVDGRERAADVGVGAEKPLAKDDQGASEDVRPLDRDADRSARDGVGQDVPRAPAKPRAAEHVHRVEHDPAQPLGRFDLERAGDDGRFLTARDGARRENARRVQPIGLASNPRERLFDPLEAADRQPELMAHPRVGARDPGRELCAADRLGG